MQPARRLYVPVLRHDELPRMLSPRAKLGRRDGGHAVERDVDQLSTVAAQPQHLLDASERVADVGGALPTRGGSRAGDLSGSSESAGSSGSAGNKRAVASTEGGTERRPHGARVATAATSSHCLATAATRGHCLAIAATRGCYHHVWFPVGGLIRMSAYHRRLLADIHASQSGLHCSSWSVDKEKVPQAMKRADGQDGRPQAEEPARREQLDGDVEFGKPHREERKMLGCECSEHAAVDVVAHHGVGEVLRQPALVGERSTGRGGGAGGRERVKEGAGEREWVREEGVGEKRGSG